MTGLQREKNPFKWYFKLFKYSIPTNVIHYCVWVLKCIRYNNYGKTSPDIAAILRNIHFRYLGVPLTPYPKQTGQEYQSRAGNTPSCEFRQTLKPDAILWDVVTVCNQLRGTPTLSYIEHWQLIYTPYKRRKWSDGL